jgi:hypothetical protein
VLALEDRCWQCHSTVRGIVGVLVGTTGGGIFVALADVDDQLVAALDRRLLVARGIGALRHRHSPGVAEGYIANSCPECDALIGRFRLEDLLSEHRARGGTLRDLDIGLTVELRTHPAMGAVSDSDRA